MKTVIANFPDSISAENAVERLNDEKYNIKNLNVITKGNREEPAQDVFYDRDGMAGSEMGLEAGTAIGTAGTFLAADSTTINAGMAMSILPIAGPIPDMMSGMVATGIPGAIVGISRADGISSDYLNRNERGEVRLKFNVSNQHASSAAKLLESLGAIDVKKY